MPWCFRVKQDRKCLYQCKRGWTMCHNYGAGHCRKAVVDDRCDNGWHITEKKYRATKIAEYLSHERESNAKTKRLQKWNRDTKPEDLPDDEAPQAKNCKRHPLLEIYLARFGYKPDEMPDRREIEDVFLQHCHREQISASEFTYEEYSEAFHYIVDIMANDVLE